jgi:hypothetical protein
MKSKIVAVLGLVALVAAGAGTRAVANEANVRGGADFQAPAVPEAASCEGYYNEIVGVCEIMGD